MSYVDVQERPSSDRVWDVRVLLSLMRRLAGRLATRDAGLPALSEDWCQQYQRDAFKH